MQQQAAYRLNDIILGSDPNTILAYLGIFK